jgi:hypothetical protein
MVAAARFRNIFFIVTIHLIVLLTGQARLAMPLVMRSQLSEWSRCYRLTRYRQRHTQPNNIPLSLLTLLFS